MQQCCSTPLVPFSTIEFLIIFHSGNDMALVLFNLPDALGGSPGCICLVRFAERALSILAVSLALWSWEGGRHMFIYNRELGFFMRERYDGGIVSSKNGAYCNDFQRYFILYSYNYFVLWFCVCIGVSFRNVLLNRENYLQIDGTFHLNCVWKNAAIFNCFCCFIDCRNFL